MKRLMSYGAWGAGLCLCASLAMAQEGTTFLTPPKGQTTYDEVASPPSVDTDIAYVDETSEDFLQTDRAPLPQDRGMRIRNRSNDGPSVFIIVGIAALLLFLLLKFGGAGTLLKSDPTTGKPKKRAKGWGLTASETPSGDILAQINAMTDRREALILLLRHCLLQAADETDTMFKRADTEREALTRLPTDWRHRDKLNQILMQTELVHYGGRQIADDDFSTALSNGTTILRGAS